MTATKWDLKVPYEEAAVDFLIGEKFREQRVCLYPSYENCPIGSKFRRTKCVFVDDLTYSAILVRASERTLIKRVLDCNQVGFESTEELLEEKELPNWEEISRTKSVFVVSPQLVTTEILITISVEIS